MNPGQTHATLAPESPGAMAKPLLLIVGMPHSGASRLEQLLPALGVTLASHRADGEASSQPSRITALQDQLLLQLNRGWHSPQALVPLPPHWLQHPATAALRAELRQLLLQEHQRHSQPWAIRDPHGSQLLPLWQQLAQELQLELRLLIAVRDPQGAVQSLLAHNHPPTGMTVDRAAVLWWHHNRELLRHSRHIPRLLVDGSAWADPAQASRQLSAIGHFCTGQSPTAAQRLQALQRIPAPEPATPQTHPLALEQRAYRRLLRGNWNAFSIAYRRHPAPNPGLRPAWRQLRASLTPSGRLQGWFEPEFYASQVGVLPQGLSGVQHYLQHGWRESRQPHPLFDPEHYRTACLQAGLLPASGPPLLHFLNRGRQQGVLPSPLFEPAWWQQRAGPQDLLRPPCLDQVHPLGCWALRLCGEDPNLAAAQLRHWQQQGVSPMELQTIAHLAPALPAATPAPANCTVALLGAPLQHWSSHAWLQHLPLTGNLAPHQLVDGSPQAPQVLLLLEPDPQGPLPVNSLLAWHTAAQAAERLVVTSACLGHLLQGMGIEPISLLHLQGCSNGWLEAPELLEWASAHLGLPPPAGLTAGTAIVVGDGVMGPHCNDTTPLLLVPGWDHLFIHRTTDARAQAAWLQACQGRGHPLVRLNPPRNAEPAEPFDALLSPASPQPNGWQPPVILQGSLTPTALAEELAWHRLGCPAPLVPATPRPQCTLLWASADEPPGLLRASVCISLHNYAHTITRALDSVSEQSLPLLELELIVVDDASSDQGAARVQAWMECQGARFGRCILLQHTSNGGLAAARNSAFHAARAAWCFVLDADNALDRHALTQVLAIADAADVTTAVVHPLIALEQEAGDGSRQVQGFLSIALWQRQRFLRGNHIDAMALVRRSAWQQVGGYQHIPGGWEDYDFWCCLIEAGFHGVCSPQRGAVYTAHGTSMSAQQTHRNLRPIARLLQARHPWLELDPAAADPGAGAHAELSRGTPRLDRI